jgi:dUTP pyrophosphatase
MPLFVKKLVEHATVPTRATSGSAGFDLSSVEQLTIPSKERAAVHTGISIKLPPGTYGRVAPRSGIAYRFGIDVLAGVIDADYREEILVILYNSGDRDFVVEKGHRIAQLIVEKIEIPDVEVVSQLSKTEREGGFGSTGV